MNETLIIITIVALAVTVFAIIHDITVHKKRQERIDNLISIFSAAIDSGKKMLSENCHSSSIDDENIKNIVTNLVNFSEYNALLKSNYVTDEGLDKLESMIENALNKD